MIERKPFITIGAVIGCAIAFAMSLGAILYVVQFSSKNQDRTCRAALDVRDAMVLILTDAQQRTKHSPAQTISEQQRKDAAEFYDNAINNMKGVSCRA